MHSKEIPIWTDEQLLELIQSDDQRAFKHIYHKYAAKLYASAYNLLRDKATCEDIVQELFIHLWLNRAALKIVTLRSYLFMATRNRVLMKLRTKKVLLDNEALDFLASNYSTDTRVREKELNIAIENAIKALPDKCQEVFILSRKQQLSNREIADRMQISVKTVENHITNAIHRLKASIGHFIFLVSIFSDFL
ncbi:RNA polymerase sigma-70 factor [Pedobacter africanus]|uniref:RNA polymerase sigma-70 factor, ECF subfamily n=1 Tax=Pedobacter africanus TaxID=151894 RepID=A0A1W2CLM1_9SPHI|nr:RNA polymerase sigma-70 factor [Pedobacter africanus]SMC86135.1 RNA polymerase sigma-70 factor, ECF subfamily [Pedobacter africanus]